MSQTKQKRIEQEVIEALVNNGGIAMTPEQLARNVPSATRDLDLDVALPAMASKGMLCVVQASGQTYYRIAPAHEWPDENMTEVHPVDVAEALADLQPVPPSEARFGLWSDGTLSIESSAGSFDLEPDECHALMQYLIRSRDNAVSVFGSAGGTA